MNPPGKAYQHNPSYLRMVMNAALTPGAPGFSVPLGTMYDGPGRYVVSFDVDGNVTDAKLIARPKDESYTTSSEWPAGEVLGNTVKAFAADAYGPMALIPFSVDEQASADLAIAAMLPGHEWFALGDEADVEAQCGSDLDRDLEDRLSFKTSDFTLGKWDVRHSPQGDRL